MIISFLLKREFRYLKCGLSGTSLFICLFIGLFIYLFDQSNPTEIYFAGEAGPDGGLTWRFWTGKKSMRRADTTQKDPRSRLGIEPRTFLR